MKVQISDSPDPIRDILVAAALYAIREQPATEDEIVKAVRGHAMDLLQRNGQRIQGLSKIARATWIDIYDATLAAAAQSPHVRGHHRRIVYHAQQARRKTRQAQ